MRSLLDLLVETIVVVTLCALIGLRGGAQPQPAAPVIVPVPTPAPTPQQPDQKPRRPLLPWRDTAPQGERVVIADRAGPQGQSPRIDYPENEWFRNIGSRVDGAGMCVFTAFEFSARWAGLEEFRGFRDWAAKYKGGGWPEKLDQIINDYCKEKGIKRPKVLQYSGDDTSFLAHALDNGQLPGCTLFRCPRYGAGVIYHMTNCANLGQECAILDNNFPEYYWFPKSDLASRIMNPDPNTHKPAYWGFVILEPPPPWVPKN